MVGVAIGVRNAAAAAIGDLYQAQAIVTGQGEVDRRRGFSLCFLEVMVKVSGDPRLFGDRRVAIMAARAGTFVDTFRYRDRMAHKPINDEQGTRDRPHDLTVDFDTAKIDAALQSLGRKPWTGERPRVSGPSGAAQSRLPGRAAGEQFECPLSHLRRSEPLCVLAGCRRTGPDFPVRVRPVLQEEFDRRPVTSEDRLV